MRRSVPALCGPPLSSELGCSGWLVSGLSPGRRSTPAGGGGSGRVAVLRLRHVLSGVVAVFGGLIG